MSYSSHLQSSQKITARFAVITLSDTRDASTDTSGQKIIELLEIAQHKIVDRQILKDEPAILEAEIYRQLDRDEVDVILTNGGTGISRRDCSVVVIERLLDQSIPGFGELFRMLSYQQIGSGAMLSRALAGVCRDKLIFSLPGSTPAVELAMTKLILPEIRHLLFELRKQP